MSSEIIQAIKDCPMVKNIPTGVGELLKELTKQDIDINSLVLMLEKFPVVCVRLVMVANSAWAAPKTEITDVKRACMQLGPKMVKSISIALLVSQQFNSSKCKGFFERKFWLASLVSADLMHLLQQQSESNLTESSTAHLIGLIHNLGLLAIAEIAPEKVSQAILLAENSDLKFCDVLQESLGISYLEATQIILQNWKLPISLSNAYYQSDNESIYHELLLNVIKVKNQLNLNILPIEFIEEDEQLLKIHEDIISKSAIYDELCGMYCR